MYYSRHLFVCTNQKEAGQTCCSNTGGAAYFEYLKTTLKQKHLHGPGKIRVSRSGCLGRCSMGPCIVIYPEARWYTYASFADLDEIIDRYLVGGEVVERLLIESSGFASSSRPRA